MRILIVNTHRALAGGVEKYLQSLMPALLQRGHEIGFLYDFGAAPGQETVDASGAPVRTWCVNELGASAALHGVAEWKPDVVYFHALENAESIGMEAALQQNYPSVLFVHNYDRTCATGRKVHSFPEPRICEKRMGAQCLLLHYPLRCGGLNPATMWSRYRRHTQLSDRLPSYQAILVGSRQMYREFERHGAAGSSLRLVPLPTVDIAPNAATPAPRRPEGRILFIGRLTDVKGCDYLIQALPPAAGKLGRPLQLTIAGDGPERPRLEKLANSLGVAVHFTGWVQTREKMDLIRTADVVAVPSLWPEPFGLVGIEAACLGVPAVGYAAGGITDWLIPGETGELAPCSPPTPQGLAEALFRALHSADHYTRLCEGAWKLSREFSIENHLARLEPILETVSRESRLLRARNSELEPCSKTC